MAWFKRSKQNIAADTIQKELPAGLWEKCPSCGEIIHKKQLEINFWTCLKCDYHFRISSIDYVSIIFDKNSFKEMDRKMRSADPLEFKDTKKYTDRISSSIKKLELFDAVRTGTGRIDSREVAFACMDFQFIGGSMGSVVGEKIARAADKAFQNKIPLIIISASGGARKKERAYLLMQMAKTNASFARIIKVKNSKIFILNESNTGGKTASNPNVW